MVIEDDTNVWANIERRMSKFIDWESVGFTSEIDHALGIIKKEKPQLIFSDWSITKKIIGLCHFFGLLLSELWPDMWPVRLCEAEVSD